MKLQIGVTGPKKLANFGKDPEGEALLAAGKYAEYEKRELAQAVAWMHTPHGSWLDETKNCVQHPRSETFQGGKTRSNTYRVSCGAKSNQGEQYRLHLGFLIKPIRRD